MDENVKLITLQGADGLLGERLRAQIAEEIKRRSTLYGERIVLDRSTRNVGSERAGKAPEKRTDADWARWFAAQEKRRRKGMRVKTENQQRAVAEGRIVVVDQIGDIIT